ncbi:MAG: MFS transporter [Puniceicoccales bacterium]|jgi:MFS family permease|nr:MFS transporter [Puniceicoccales bacterium]
MKENPHKKSTNYHRRIGWCAWLTAAIFYLYEYFIRVAPSVMEGHLRQTFHVNATTLGFATGLYYMVYGPMQIVVGPLFDRFGARKLFFLAVCSVSFGCFFASIPASHISMFALGRLFMGFGSAFAFIGTVYVATMWFPPSKLAFLSGMTTALGMFGAILGQTPIAKIVNWLNWRNAWVLAGGLGILCALSVYRWLPSGPQESSCLRNGADGARQSMPPFLKILWTITKNPQTWIIGAVACFLFFPLIVFADFWGIRYIELATGADKSHAAMANGMLYLGWLLGSPIAGALSDHLRHRRRFFTISCLIGTILLLCILIPSHFSIASIALLLFLLGLVSSPQVICFIASVELNPSHLKATAMAMINTIVMLFGGMAQPLCGFFMDLQQRFSPIFYGEYTLRQYRMALMILPMAMFAGFILSFFIRESFGRHHLPEDGKDVVCE